MNLFFWSCNISFAASLGIWSDYERSGKENEPSSGSLLIVANHQSNMDPPIVARSISHRTLFPAKRELFKTRLVNLLLRMWGAFPLTRGEPDANAYRKILSTLAEPNGCVTQAVVEGQDQSGALGTRATRHQFLEFGTADVVEVPLEEAELFLESGRTGWRNIVIVHRPHVASESDGTQPQQARTHTGCIEDARERQLGRVHGPILIHDVYVG